jgi:acyl-homoserine lactone acylase PvdQ
VAQLRESFDPGVRMARTVTIVRDQWGVPHIYGPTDASVVFGMAWAQAEDNVWQLEEDYLWALGRAASLYGESALPNDLVRAAFEVERLSRAEYQREPPERRALWDAWAAGLNHWIRRHPETPLRVIRRFEPWFPFAIFRGAAAGATIDGARLRDVVATPVGSAQITGPARPLPALRPAGGGAGADVDPAAQPLATLEGEPGQPTASNAWAVAPSRTRDGHALLFQNPHVGFFGGGQRWEVSVESAAGWHFSGFAILGTPIPRAGHNERLGWTHTNTAADGADTWIEHFDHPSDALAYRYGAEWRQALPFEDTILVNTPAGLEQRRYRFLRTHHGPVIAAADGRRMAVRMARFEEGGALQQWYAMGRARSLDEFRAALAGTAFPISNTMYADADGNIFYLHGNAVPRRDARFDWSRPVDGADPATDWQGYHTLAELPQVLNPAAGWLQNTNSTPFLATADGDNPAVGAFPSYMAPESDNARARVSRRILEETRDWTFEAWAKAGFDTRVLEAEAVVPALVDEWERMGASDPERAVRLDTLIEELRNWDRISTIESTTMTLFVYWSEAYAERGAAAGAWPRVRALERAIERLRTEWQSTKVPWGERNRLQRVHTSGSQPFDDARPSLPVPGGPGTLGMVFNFGTQPGPDGKRRYGVRGHTWVGVVEFAPRVRAATIVTFGQSADSLSSHWFDQAELYARGSFKPEWFLRSDVEAHAQRRYHPGEPMAPPATSRETPAKGAAFGARSATVPVLTRH